MFAGQVMCKVDEPTVGVPLLEVVEDAVERPQRADIARLLDQQFEHALGQRAQNRDEADERDDQENPAHFDVSFLLPDLSQESGTNGPARDPQRLQIVPETALKPTHQT